MRVAYHFGTTTATGYSNDISLGGMFLECQRVAPPGARVYLRVHLPGSGEDDPLKIIGTVTRSLSEEAANAAGTAPGMGLHFEVAYARTREQLGAFMESLLRNALPRGQGSDPPPARAPAEIRLVRGSTEERKTYAARFPSGVGDAPRVDSMRPQEVERAFSFDGRASLRPMGSARRSGWWLIGGVGIALLAIGYSLLVYVGVLPGPG